MQSAKKEQNGKKVLDIFIKKINQAFEKSVPEIQKINDIPDLFTKQYFQKPVICIIRIYPTTDSGVYPSTFCEYFGMSGRNKSECLDGSERNVNVDIFVQERDIVSENRRRWYKFAIPMTLN